MEHNRQTNKVLCYCEKCGKQKITYPGAHCSYCGPWGIMKSVDEFKKQLLISANPQPKLLTRIPDTVDELLRYWGIA